MQDYKKRLAFVTWIYWVMLSYIMAALVWWFISLEQQNISMFNLRVAEVSQQDPQYKEKIATIIDYKDRKHGQYVGEGFIFMVLILIGAVFVYRYMRRYLKLGQLQQNFMMAVTHELKTPIAVAKLNIETMQKRQLDQPQKERLLQLTLIETERLNDLCDNILLASRFDNGKVAQHREPLSFSTLVSNSIDDFRTRFPERVFLENILADIQLNGDPLLLKLLVNNLLENAVKYAPKTRPIHISISNTETQVMLQVADEGPGIPVAERKKVFEKFYRQGDEKTRQKKGTGLGLFLARRIAVDHKGSISIADNTPQGTIFTVTLSKA